MVCWTEAEKTPSSGGPAKLSKMADFTWNQRKVSEAARTAPSFQRCLWKLHEAILYQFPFTSKSRNFWPKKELSIFGSRKDMNGRQIWNSSCCSCRFYKIFALDMRPCRSLNWSKRKLQLVTSVQKFALLGISGYLSKSLASWVSVEGREKGQ